MFLFVAGLYGLAMVLTLFLKDVADPQETGALTPSIPCQIEQAARPPRGLLFFFGPPLATN